MKQENVEIVRRIFDGWEAGDFRVAVAEADCHRRPRTRRIAECRRNHDHHTGIERSRAVF